MLTRFGFGGGRRGERKGHDINIDLEVTLDDLFLGRSIDIDVEKQVICPSCRGSGAKSDQHIKKCGTCGGSGVQIVRQQFGHGMYQQMQMTCSSCGGKGTTITAKCPTCHGHKVSTAAEQMTIYIERGMMAGEKIVFEGESDQNPDMAAGDLIFHLKARNHDVFTRHGMDLHMNHTIDLKQGLLGFKIIIKHMDNSDIVLERGGTTQNGNVI